MILSLLERLKKVFSVSFFLSYSLRRDDRSGSYCVPVTWDSHASTASSLGRQRGNLITGLTLMLPCMLIFFLQIALISEEQRLDLCHIGISSLVVLKMWFPAQEPWHHLATYSKCKSLGPRGPSRVCETDERAQQSVLTSLPHGSDWSWSLRTKAPGCWCLDCFFQA